jgi:hypothetical protein
MAGGRSDDWRRNESKERAVPKVDRCQNGFEEKADPGRRHKSVYAERTFSPAAVQNQGDLDKGTPIQDSGR